MVKAKDRNQTIYKSAYYYKSRYMFKGIYNTNELLAYYYKSRCMFKGIYNANELYIYNIHIHIHIYIHTQTQILPNYVLKGLENSGTQYNEQKQLVQNIFSSKYTQI